MWRVSFICLLFVCLYLVVGEGNGYPLQYSCLKNLMNRGAWQGIVHGVTRVRHDLVTRSPSPFLVGACKLLVAACELFYGMWDPEIRDWTQCPCIGTTESQSLDHQGSPWIVFDLFKNVICYVVLSFNSQGKNR